MVVAVMSAAGVSTLAMLMMSLPRMTARRLRDRPEVITSEYARGIRRADVVTPLCFVAVLGSAAVADVLTGGAAWPVWLLAALVGAAWAWRAPHAATQIDRLLTAHGVAEVPASSAARAHRRRSLRWLDASKILFAAGCVAGVLSRVDGLERLRLAGHVLLLVVCAATAIGGWRLLRGPDPHPFFVRGR